VHELVLKMCDSNMHGDRIKINTLFIMGPTRSQISAVPDGNVHRTSLRPALGPQSFPRNGHMVEV
jgi:hypothetical protein